MTMESRKTNPGQMPGPVLDLSHVEIEVPDYEELKQQRIGRNRQAMEAADKWLAKEILPQTDNRSLPIKSAICIQRMWRGMMGRKKFVDLLYDKYEKEYQEAQDKIAQQMKEGELLVDNRELERSLADGQTVRRNKTRQYLSHILTIQRPWRQYHGNKVKQTVCSVPCSDSNTDQGSVPNPISTSTSTTPIPSIVINDTDTDQGSVPNPISTSTSTTPISSIATNDSNTDQGSVPNTTSTSTSTTPIPSIVINDTDAVSTNNLESPAINNHHDNNSNSSSSSISNNVITINDHSSNINNDNNNSSNSSDREDEPSETESAFACDVMTDLTPEENQGGGADKSFPTSRSSDSIGDQQGVSSSSLAEEARGQSSSSTSGQGADGGVAVLDAAVVLSGLEKNRLSPRRYSVDVECDSVTSDYSELGGTLKDIEKDVCFLDRDTLNHLGVGEDGEEGGGFISLAQLGLRRASSSEKQENESEADFQKRLRKVSILSLAQEFALLKKFDSQACPINFHRTNKSKSLRHSATPSPVSSRGQSVERSRRTPSKSPLRTNSKDRNIRTVEGAQGGTSSMDATLMQQQQQPASSSSPSSSQNHKAVSRSVQDLPTNEARRRNSGSKDLPVNMRPERQILMQQQQQHKQPPQAISPQSSVQQPSPIVSSNSSGNDVTTRINQSGVSTDGDFEVYNIENTMPANLDWKTLQLQMERKESDDRTRLQACKNEREEIRRRLAMTDDDKDQHDDDDNDDDDGNNDDSLTGSMLSNPRLQTSLEGAQNMQICFIHDDLLDDDEDDDVTVGSHASHDVREGRVGCDDVISTSEDDTLSAENEATPHVTSTTTTKAAALSNRRPDPKRIASRQSQLQTEATLALAQASTMARMQLEVERQTKKKSPIADMVGIPTLGNGRRLRLSRSKLTDMNVAQLQVLVNDLHSQIELLNEDLVHLLIERDDLHMEQDSMLVDIEDLTSHCHDPKATNNNKTSHNNNNNNSRPGHHRKDVRRH